MIKYKKVVSKSDRAMYYMNGNLVKKEAIPVSVLNMIETGAEIELPSGDEPALSPEILEKEEKIDTSEKRAPQINEQGQILHTQQQMVDENANDNPQTPPDERVCVFTGEPATRSKFLNGQTIYLSDEAYNTHSSGEIVARARELATSK